MLFLRLRPFIWIMIGLLGFVFCSSFRPAEAFAKPQEQELTQMSALNKIAETAYHLAKEGKILEARKQLDLLGKLAIKARYNGITTVEGVDAFMTSIVSARRVFNAAQFSPDEGIISTARVWLAADALTHPKQPMWLQYYKVLTDDLLLMKKSVAENRLEDARKSYTQMYRDYSIIRPAVIINRGTELSEKAQSLFTFTHTALAAQTLQIDRMKTATDEFQKLWDEMFFKTDVQTSLLLTPEPHPLLWMTGIGSVIITILAFVGWRKYQFERDKVTVYRSFRE